MMRSKTLNSCLARTLLMGSIVTGLPLVTLVPAYAADVTFNFKVQFDGTAPFDVNNNPGNDASDNNNVIRTQDLVTYKWEYAVNNGAANNVILQATLPPEQEIPSLPFVCGAGSALSFDAAGNQNISCKLGTVPNGSSGSIELKARVLGRRRAPVGTFVGNGDKTQGTGSLTADNVGVVTPVITQDLTISATPKADLIKDRAAVIGLVKGPDNVTNGFLIRYPITLVVGGSGKGSEALVGDINFTDQLLTRVGASTDGPPVPTAQLYTWGTAASGTKACDWLGGSANSYYGGYPFGKLGAHPTYGLPERSVVNSGNWTCTQTAPGEPIQFTITGADTSGNNVPTKTYHDTALPANKTYLVAGTVHLWVPINTVIDAGNQLNVRNKLSGLVINGASGQPNVEPSLTNNQYDHTLLYSLSGSFSSYYSKSVDARGTPLPGQSALLGGDGPIMPGQIYAERVVLNNTGFLPWASGAILCTAIDNQTQEVLPLATDPTSAVKNFSTAGLGTKYVIEYGTGDYATVTEHQKATCRDQDSPTGWTTDISSVPGLADAVTKIRVRALEEVPSGSVWDIAVNLRARNNYLGTTTKVPNGTRLVEHSSFYIEGYGGTAGMPTDWRGGVYNRDTHAAASWGDRLTMTRAIVRVDKQNIPNTPAITALAGAEITFKLIPTVTATIDPAPVTPTVVLKDILPATMNYVPGSATLAPTSIVTNPDQTKTIIWDLGVRTPNQAIPEITYKATIRPDAPNNSTSVNTAVIESEDDVSPASARTDIASVNIGNAAAFRIFKEVEKVLLNPNEPITYNLFYANTGSSDVGASRFIDVLPYLNDGRTPNTNYTGSLSFSSITGSNGETFEFTNRPYGTINTDPNDASNQVGGATQWCSAAQFGTAGCPSGNSNVTAIRINAPAFPKNAPTRSINLILQPNGNTQNSFYTNNFTGRANGLLGLLQSNDVFAKVQMPTNLLLVKRITAINGIPITSIVDDPNTDADNDAAWPSGYLKGAINGGVVKPGDEIDYTIYFLSNGDSPVTNAKMCDLVPSNTTYLPTGFNGLTPIGASGLSGADRGIQLDRSTNSIYLTGVTDGDIGTFFPAGTIPNATCSAANQNGAVTIQLGVVPHTGYGGTPAQAYGLMRFRTKVK